MKTLRNAITSTNITLTLLLLSCLVAMGGPVTAFILEQHLGWDALVYDRCMCCFPAGLVALFLTAWLMEMVDERKSKEHADLMEELHRKNAK